MSFRWQILWATFVHFFSSPKTQTQSVWEIIFTQFIHFTPTFSNKTKTPTNTHSFVSSHNRYQPDACHNKMFCFMFGHIPFYAFIFLVFLPFGIFTSSRREKPHKNACGCFIEKLPNCNRSPSRNGDKRTTRNNLHCLSLYCSVYTMNTIQKL